jgi:hypothetical protein
MMLSREQRVACLESACALVACRINPWVCDDEWDQAVDAEYAQLLETAERLQAETIEERERLWCEAVARVCDESAELYRKMAERVRRRALVLQARRGAQ